MRDLFLPLICSLLLAPVASGAEARATRATTNSQAYDSAHLVSGGNVPGFANYVGAMVQDAAGTLYVGGKALAAGAANVRGVVRWDGTNWSQVGSLPGGDAAQVMALAIGPGGDLFAAVIESFKFTSSSFVYRWDGKQWDQLLSSPDSFYALACDPLGRVYLGLELNAPFSGSLPANLMTWDGTAWTPLAGAPDGAVATLRYDAALGLLVGGNFLQAGGQPARSVARWDGAQWLAFGSGLQGTVRSLAKAPDGKVYAAGDFTFTEPVFSRGAAVWDGQQWSPLGTGSFLGARVIGVSPAGRVVLGGQFTQLDDDLISLVAEWDGTRWQPLCQGPLGRSFYGPSFGTINALAWDAAGRLIVGGQLERTGVGAKGLATFENGQFRPLSAGVPYARRVVSDRQGGIYLMGDFAWIDGQPAGSLAHFDGLRWSTLQGGLTNRFPGGVELAALTEIACAPDGKLYVLGSFNRGGDQPLAGSIASWDGQSWSSVSQPPDGFITQIGLAPDGSLLAWAIQTLGPDDYACRLLRLDGAQWSTFRVFSTTGSYRSPWSLVSSGARLLVHLSVAGPGGTFTNQLHQWEGGTWTDIGSGFNNVVRDASGDTLGNFYVCGDFTNIGGVAAKGVARWNGSAWSGFGGDAPGGSYRLSASPDGSIVASGTGALSQWDGQAWSSLASLVKSSPVIEEMALDTQGNRWICGDFNLVAGQVSSSLFRLLRQPAVATQFTSAVPSATVVLGVPFSHTFTGTGNPPPQFGLGSGSLPPGLTLTNAGVLSGTPTGGAGQIFQATVRAANGVSGEATQSFSIRVVSRLTSFLESYGLEGGALAATADPDGDGLSNLLEYAFLRNPTVASQPPPMTSSILDLSGQRYASLRFLRSPAATDLSYIVEATGGLGGGTWSEVARSEAGNPCTGPGFVQESAAGDGIDVTVRDTVAIESGAPQRFLRVRVVLAPTR